MKKQSTTRPRTAANNAMWQAIRDQDMPGLRAALLDGANPDVRRRNQYPMQAVVDNTNPNFVISAWNALIDAGANCSRQTDLMPTTTLAVSLLATKDSGLEAVWVGCPELRKSLLYSLMCFSNHKGAGLTPEQWPGALDRIFALDGCHQVAGNWLATFGGDWHHGGFDPKVVERLVAFDVDARRIETWPGCTDSLCQSIALYDQHAAVVNELCKRHRGWLHQDGGTHGHKLVEQLIKHGESRNYYRLHNLAPHLLASNTPSAVRAMAAASFNCSITSLTPELGVDPAKMLAAQGFSLAGAFSMIEHQTLYDMIKTWQRNHWVARSSGHLPHTVAEAIERVRSLGLDVHGTWKTGVDRPVEDCGEVSGSLDGVGLMHIWCTNNEIYHDTKGKVLPELSGFETPQGPAILEVATRSIKDDPTHGGFLIPSLKTLNWALSCGADMAHPGTVRAGERILFALCNNKAPVTERNANRWVEAVSWLVEHNVHMPYIVRLDDLDGIIFERPMRWNGEVEKIKMMLVVANHERMHQETVAASAPVRSKPRL